MKEYKFIVNFTDGREFITVCESLKLAAIEGICFMSKDGFLSEVDYIETENGKKFNVEVSIKATLID